MVLDLVYIAPESTKEEREILVESQRKRYVKEDIITECEKLYKEWKEARGKQDTLNMESNIVKKKIGQLKKKDKNDPCTELLQEKAQIEKNIEEQAKNVEDILKKLNEKYSKCGNIVHESVPVDDNEDNNKVEKTWGVEDRKTITVTGKPGAAQHHDILKWIGGYDQERGTKVAGHRGYFLTGYGVLLNQALLQYGLQFLLKNKYTAIQTPMFMKSEIMSETCQISDFSDNLYKIDLSKEKKEETGNKDETSSDSLYMIATSEQPISAMYRKEWMEPTDLPIKYGGISTCFRKEAGSAGKELRGIFRVHQFEKIEQFCYCKPEESWKILEEMVDTSERFYQSLGIPYRIMNIVSGALNDAAAKKFDIEMWFPGFDGYRELVSISNCTDYQSRALEVRLRRSKDKKEYVHMLNGTLCASERAMCCLIENYQTETGVIVPEVLRPFVGVDFIPYIKELLPGYKKEKEKKEKK